MLIPRISKQDRDGTRGCSLYVLLQHYEADLLGRTQAYLFSMLLTAHGAPASKLVHFEEKGADAAAHAQPR